jgi:hypothetical protein
MEHQVWLGRLDRARRRIGICQIARHLGCAPGWRAREPGNVSLRPALRQQRLTQEPS